MDKFVSSWSDGKTLPENYIFPPEQRPGNQLVPPSDKRIPIIDLGMTNRHDHASLVQQLMEASQDLGAFQVINHGVSRKIMDETRAVLKEFFELPAEEKSRYCSWDASKTFIVYTSNFNYDEEDLHFWRDAITQKCTPLDERMPHWPQKPARYREVIGEYTVKVKELGSRILDLMCEGLGLEPGYFSKELTQDVELIANHYPACPDPSLTLGAGKHSDRSLITILIQGDIPGLQIFKDGEWIGVHPNPDSFVVNLGYMMQIASNGKLINGDHRAVTNAEVARESAALFLCPTRDCIVEPAKPLVNEENPPLYRGVQYAEYLKSHNEGRRLKAPELILKPFRIEG